MEAAMKDQTVSLSGGGSEEPATGQILGKDGKVKVKGTRHRAEAVAAARRRLESFIPVAIEVAENAVRNGKLKLSPREREALANARAFYATGREE
jgi:hypothetical protein